MVAFYHINAVDENAKRKLWQQSRKLGMELKIYEKIIVETALKGSKWENMKFFLEGSIQKERYRNLWNGYQCVVFIPKIDASALLKLEKKSSEAFFMAVVVEDRILDRKGLQDLADLPPMDQLLSQTAAILKTPIQKTHQLLGSNLQTLSSNLDQYVKDQSPSSEEK